MIGAAIRASDAEFRDWSRELGRGSVRIENRQSAVHGLQPKASNDFACEKVQPLHLKSPSSLRPQHGVERPVSASSSVARNATTSREEIRKSLETALTTCVPQYREPAKQVAARLEQSVGKVASIRRKIPEGMIDAALMCVHYPEFAKAWARVTLMESDLHPEAARALNDFVTAIQRRGR